MISYLLFYFIAIMVAIVALFTLYYYYKYFSTYVYLKTVPCAPLLPLIGSAHLIRTTEAFYQKGLQFSSEYGRTYWLMIGPMPVCFSSDPTLLEIVLSSSKHINKPPLYKIVRDVGAGNGLLTAKGDNWRAQRKHLVPTFHFKILEQFITIFNKHSEAFVKDLEGECSKDYTDVHGRTPSWALNQLTETVMGLKPEDNKENNRMYLENMKILLKIAMERFIRPLEFIDFTFSLTRKYQTMITLTKQIHDYISNVIQKKEAKFTLEQSSKNKAKSHKQKSVSLDLLIESSMSGNKVGEADLAAQVQTILLAGYDTTAGSMAYALYNLAENPDVQEKVYQEIRDVLCDAITQEISISHLQDMTYLEMAFKESMRMFPHIPVIARELLEDVKWGSVTLPKGLTVMTNISALHRDPEIYPEPEKFLPERFSPENMRERHPFAYIPFSAGPRNCIGQKYGMLAVKVGLAKLLLAYEFISVGHKPKLAAEIALVPKNGTRVAIRKRKY